MGSKNWIGAIELGYILDEYLVNKERGVKGEAVVCITLHSERKNLRAKLSELDPVCPLPL